MLRINRTHHPLLLLNEFKILFIIILLLFVIGLFGQISAFDGNCNGSVQRHLFRIIAGICIMFFVYRCNFKIWNHYAYVFYVFSMFALIAVEIIGVIKLGAQRWIDLYFCTFQPSELMKLSLILALARYYSLLSRYEIKETKNHLIPFIMTIFPMLLVLKQPDLGTAGLLFCTGVTIIFLSGLSTRVCIVAAIFGILLCPFSWYFLHDYQKNRIMTFLNPDMDPLGSGYHILQSKIAVGSGMVFGKGFLCGTQSKLNFLPEKNTDFIFTTIAEETGFVGASIIIALFLCLTFYFFYAGYNAKTMFSKLLCFGLGSLLFLHVFVNIAMVIGVVPIVGIPLPFLSYGGSSMITFMISCGLVMSVFANKKM